ncbi:MAG: hypothetical protein P8P83_05660 [Rickettsiaceae bacterium]|nr:hypothetical protein [Rickettsiaceae bacterium]
MCDAAFGKVFKAVKIEKAAAAEAGSGFTKELGAEANTLNAELPEIHLGTMEYVAKPSKQGRIYETKVQELYKHERKADTNYGVELHGNKLKGRADWAFKSAGDVDIAIEAKYIKDWNKSVYNPARVKDKPYLQANHEKVLLQARKYQNTLDFQEVVYHTNSYEFANHYSTIFTQEGITKIKFVISPVEIKKKIGGNL